MSINLNLSQVTIREKRLKSIVGYQGTIKDLAEQSQSGCLKNASRGFSQATNCNSGCAQGYLSSITDAAIVNHGPIGCAGDVAGANAGFQWGQRIRDWNQRNVRIINTNMSEKAVVFGGDQILKEGILKAYERFNPKAIFVTTSCASGIIGDDIESTMRNVEAEIGIPVVPVFCEGFRSQIWASGFDAAFHALLSRIVKPAEKKRPELVNVINFAGSGRAVITEIFGRLGLVPQFGIPYSNIEEISRWSEAAATISICGTLGSYMGNGLEQNFGVPYVTALQPHGISGFDDWLTKLGETVGKEKEVEEYLAEQKVIAAPDLEEIKFKLKGKKVVVGMGPSFAHNYIRFLEDLGMEVVWGFSWHYDAKHDHGGCPSCTVELTKIDKDIPVSVSDQQNHEVINLLSKVKPDIFIGRHPGMSVWATKMGIPAIMVSDEYSAFGYQGTIEFGHRIIDALTNNSLALNLSKRIQLPYTEWWLEQDPFEFLKQKNKRKESENKKNVAVR
ncbi:nitrogenase component 1 [Paenibacillus sp. URB8-2]|uniref:nitrogenase component 1 n=1 Tax=Paenibacillus sp. URB8-2 TaxID=2741301 RepID=UPI0015BE9A3A|nr:nitrogenase component 1 [Paenibacillus sp. URB8-2]BCG59769.1 nitrogenase [Paenibacillus sp. URB8-2]